jgi:hypothetical protein
MFVGNSSNRDVVGAVRVVIFISIFFCEIENAK